MSTNELIIKGRTIKEIYQDNEHLMFKLENDDVFLFYHWQDCCEDVSIDQIDGDLNDLIGSPLLMAEETTRVSDTDWGTETWTFYRFATAKGYVTVKWYGNSNGYYSEAVDMDLIKEYNDFEPIEMCERAKWGNDVYLEEDSEDTEEQERLLTDIEIAEFITGFQAFVEGVGMTNKDLEDLSDVMQYVIESNRSI